MYAVCSEYKFRHGVKLSTCIFTKCSEKFIQDGSICTVGMQIMLDNLECQSLIFQMKLILVKIKYL